MAAMAETQNLPAERRKAQEILQQACDDVLAGDENCWRGKPTRQAQRLVP